MVETRPLLTSLGLSDTKVLRVTLTPFNVREFDVTRCIHAIFLIICIIIICYATAYLV